MIKRNGNKITFMCQPEGQIKRAFLVGDFNDWKVNNGVMSQCDEGTFALTIALQPGRYEYKFYADGVYWNDTDADEQAINQFGTLNSVVNVG